MSIKIRASYSKPQELPLILSALAPLASRPGAAVKTVPRESRYQHLYLEVMDPDDLQLDATLKDAALARKAEKKRAAASASPSVEPPPEAGISPETANSGAGPSPAAEPEKLSETYVLKWRCSHETIGAAEEPQILPAEDQAPARAAESGAERPL